MILDIYKDHLLERSKVENIVIFDLNNEGEISIYKNHIKFSGIGSYIIYNNIKKIENFLYHVENNIITIYIY